MKPFDILKAPFTLGLLGLVMLAMAVVLLVATYFSYDGVPSFDDNMDEMRIMDALENEVTDTLTQMQLNEAYALYYVEYNIPADQDYVALAQADDEQISALLAELRDDDYFLYEDAQLDLEAWTVFDQLRADHRATFEGLYAVYEADNPEVATATIELLQNENDELDSQLDTMIFQVEDARQTSLEDFSYEINFIIWTMCIGLIAILLLALLGYQRIAAAIEPLNTLTSAITAIGGGLYRSQLVSKVVKRSGPAGDCARKLDQLAAGLTERSAGRRQEIERLRQVLYESRRRRLKITRPVEERRSTP